MVIVAWIFSLIVFIYSIVVFVKFVKERKELTNKDPSNKSKKTLIAIAVIVGVAVVLSIVSIIVIKLITDDLMAETSELEAGLEAFAQIFGSIALMVYMGIKSFLSIGMTMMASITLAIGKYINYCVKNKYVVPTGYTVAFIMLNASDVMNLITSIIGLAEFLIA